MNILKKLATFGAAFALSAGAALADVDVTVSGTGGGSYTGVWVKTEDVTVVEQTNVTKIDNAIVSVATTGDNSASGGDVYSGDAYSGVAVLNVSGLNAADLGDCGCPDDDVNVEVKNTGKWSVTKVGVEDKDVLVVEQKNYTDVDNYVYSKADTGGNKAGKGGWWWNKKGDVTTGDAKSKVFVGNYSGGNLLKL